MSELAELLGAEPPAGIVALSADAQAQLAALIAQARAQQGSDLAAAFAATLKHVPFPVRGLARKMLLG